ncbi:MAG: hypothetical protein WCD86_09015 [Ktedonobacteraceae bacterium]
MTVNRREYPPRTIWRAMRQEALERAGYRCELCGLPDAAPRYNADNPHPLYKRGTPYRVYLQLAHKSRYETWNRDAETLILCPWCHGKFDATHSRKKTVKRYAPVGQVVVWVWYKGERCLAAEARWFDDLFQAVAALSTGLIFEVEAEIVMRMAGSGRYRRTEQGIETLHEEGACVSFGALLHDILQGVC